MHKINLANIKDWAANYDGELFDGILCDPPYELGFMGKSWDSSGIAFDVEMWQNIYKLLKPGAHLLAFSGSRTYHRMAVAIEDAGFEIRDMIEWVYGSGFPKSLNIGKAIDKRGGTTADQSLEFAAYIKDRRLELNIPITKADQIVCDGTTNYSWFEGRPKGQRLPRKADYLKMKELLKLDDRYDDFMEETEREFLGNYETDMGGLGGERLGVSGGKITKGTSEWEGYGTALKPAHEPCVLARKPIEGNVAQNCLKHGVGGLNIDGSRVVTEDNLNGGAYSGNTDKLVNEIYGEYNKLKPDNYTQPTGRFPANLIHDGYDEVVGLFPQTGKSKAGGRSTGVNFGGNGTKDRERTGHNDNGGSAARFFYTAKASKSERNAGLDGFEPTITNDGRKKDIDNAFQRGTTLRSNHHPTVKPLALTKYLANLIKPPKGGRLLVPFSGSGSEMIGALQAGWEYVEGVELTEEYIPIAEARIKHWMSKIQEAKDNEQPSLFDV